MSASDPQGATVSIVIPTLGGRGRLGVSLAAALSALDERGFDPDEILVVDDSGEERATAAVPEVLGGIESRRKGSVHVLQTQGQDGLGAGFGAAVQLGAEKARGSLLMILQDDVEVRGDALTDMAKLMQREQGLFGVAPAVAGMRTNGEVLAPVAQELRLVDDRLEVRESELHRPGSDAEAARAPRVTFGAATALMVRRPRFLELGGFDPLFAPFTWEDVDLGVSAARSGMPIVRLASAVVTQHVDLPSLWDDVDDEVARAVIERNRLLMRWKHLSSRAEATDHLVSLWRRVIEAGLSGDREMLEQVCLAFERLGDVTTSRAKMQGAKGTLGDALMV